jgi:hypothetical protein
LHNKNLNFTTVYLQVESRLITRPELGFAAAGWWFPPGTQVSSTNNIDGHDYDDITEILFKVVLSTITPVQE